MEYADEAGHDDKEKRAFDELAIINLSESGDERQQYSRSGVATSSFLWRKAAGVDGHIYLHFLKNMGIPHIPKPIGEK
ncbi:hypothetical protein Pcaca03_25160 [Pectobacterium carotovorum subsp. carotovorum]|uniref:Uncharacterized protein n=1 Tax=Pectobacterium carotovorum subsp. carotovorum TaxID=555 RepID=A0AAI9L1J2_PECCC|nr:hypothetical protein SOASR016_23800 [Pectobacterium carotovorum subsp. carotovorum]GLV70072.1 hypothetical protein Pcaca03_25160 [Pectobacterium carotovorum subsp. carotovorum]